MVCDLDDEAPVGLEQPVLGDVRGRIVLTNTGSCVCAQGYFAYTIRLECSRCVQPVDIPVSVDVNEECALSEIDNPRGTEADQIPLLDDNTVDLSELLRQLMDLNTPLQVLCSPSCCGLCPSCGANLNKGPCDCDVQEIDPRLAALKHLRNGLI